LIPGSVLELPKWLIYFPLRVTLYPKPIRTGQTIFGQKLFIWKQDEVGAAAAAGAAPELKINIDYRNIDSVIIYPLDREPPVLLKQFIGQSEEAKKEGTRIAFIAYPEGKEKPIRMTSSSVNNFKSLVDNLITLINENKLEDALENLTTQPVWDMIVTQNEREQLVHLILEEREGSNEEAIDMLTDLLSQFGLRYE
jgi:hypothetical protein